MQVTLSQHLSSIPDSAVSGIISAAARAAWQDVIPMAGGEPTFEMLVNPREALRDFDERALSKYSPFTGHGELLELICGKLARLNGIEASTSDLIVVPGGAGALWGSLMAVVDPGSEVILTDPCWEHYHSIVKMVGARPVSWPLFADRMNGELDFDALLARITPATRALLINTPLNPCGYVFSEADLRRLIQICEDRGVQLICDEEYETFVFGQARHVSPRSLSPNVISLYAMSKSFAVTGARVGYVAARPEVVALIRRAGLYSYMFPSSPAQCLAIAILRQDYVGYLSHVRAHYEAKMERLHSLFAAVPGIELEKPMGGVYLFPHLPEIEGRNAAHALIEKDHLLCVPGDVAGPSAAGRVRFFFGLDDAVLQDAAQRLRGRFTA
ncbi:pyridoxal phosphate-dependent aminotransferase [Roseateles sp. BYS96W]|uniref:Pyridoxal phosphate-dependent aminotransferase n=1 Tax=Pelomonas nitida TaxID=3299027 RepID=A0ABW7GCY6_9BURK